MTHRPRKRIVQTFAARKRLVLKISTLNDSRVKKFTKYCLHERAIFKNAQPLVEAWRNLALASPVRQR